VFVLDDSGTTTELEHGSEGNPDAARTPVLLLFGPEALTARGFPRLVPLADGLTVGRGKLAIVGNYLALPDKLLSRTHLRVSSARGGLDVEDAGSLNGTYLDGHRLTEPRRLNDGAMLAFGRYAAVFRRVSAEELRAIQAERTEPFGPTASVSPRLALTLAKLRRLARTEAEPLLVGETGVGKEVYARAIHRASGRPGAFVSLDCATMPADLIESELFGGAPAEKPGLLEATNGGTLFLDEIGELPAPLQSKLFRFLQGRPRRVDVRVLTATSALGGEAAGRLQPELLALLGADPIVIPPLRERAEDLGPLLDHFVGGKLREIEPAAFRALSLYGWPLNDGELESCVRRAVALATDRVLRVEQLPAAVSDALMRLPVGARRRTPRPAPARGELECLLREHRGNVSQMARSLGRRWNVVWRWLVRHELEPERFRE
jgi:DNA-binding NtrC family response regulator